MAAADQSRTPDDCLWLVAGTGSSGPEHPRHFEYCLSFLILVIWEMLFLPGAAWGVSFFPKPQLGLQALILLGAGSPKTGTQGLFVGTMLEPCWNHGSLVGCFFLNFDVFFVSGPCFFPVYPSGPLSIRDMPCLGPNPGRFGVVHQRAVHIKGETRTVPGSKSPWHRPAFSFLFDLCQGQTS